MDPGEKFPWKKISKYNIGSWYYDSKKELKLINQKNIVNLFFKNLYKIGYRYFEVNKRTKKDKLIIKSFQQHYQPKNVSGKIDRKSLKISHLLASRLKLT